MLKVLVNIDSFAFANVLKFGLKIISLTFAIQNREVEQSAAADRAHNPKVGSKVKDSKSYFEFIPRSRVTVARRANIRRGGRRFQGKED